MLEPSGTDPGTRRRPLRLEQLVQVPGRDVQRRRDGRRAQAGVAQVVLDEPQDLHQQLLAGVGRRAPRPAGAGRTSCRGGRGRCRPAGPRCTRRSRPAGTGARTGTGTPAAPIAAVAGETVAVSRWTSRDPSRRSASGT